MGVLYASGQVGTMSLTRTDGEALIVKPYRSEDIVRALRIVEQMIGDRNASRHFPKGFSILDGGPDLRTPLIYQTGPNTSVKSGCSCSICEKRCISGRSHCSRMVGIRSYSMQP